MDHMGIDLGSKDSQVCVRNSAGEIVGEWRWRTDKLMAFLKDRPRVRVIIETCTEAFRVAAFAQRAGHEVGVVAATLVRSLGVGHRGGRRNRRSLHAASTGQMGITPAVRPGDSRTSARRARPAS